MSLTVRLETNAADSDEAGHVFRSEAGRRSERKSDPASGDLRVGMDDSVSLMVGQAAGSSERRLRRLSPVSSMR